MGVYIQKDDYTNDSHDYMVRTMCDELRLDGYKIVDVETKYGIWLLRKNVTKITYKRKKKKNGALA